MAGQHRFRARLFPMIASTMLIFQAIAAEVPVAHAADPSAAPSASSEPEPSTLPDAGAGAAAAAATSEAIVGYRATGYRFKVVGRGAEAGFEATGFDDTVAGWTDGSAAFGSGGGVRSNPR